MLWPEFLAPKFGFCSCFVYFILCNENILFLFLICEFINSPKPFSSQHRKAWFLEQDWVGYLECGCSVWTGLEFIALPQCRQQEEEDLEGQLSRRAIVILNEKSSAWSDPLGSQGTQPVFMPGTVSLRKKRRCLWAVESWELGRSGWWRRRVQTGGRTQTIIWAKSLRQGWKRPSQRKRKFGIVLTIGRRGCIRKGWAEQGLN